MTPRARSLFGLLLAIGLVAGVLLALQFLQGRVAGPDTGGAHDGAAGTDVVTYPKGARVEQYEMMLADLHLENGPADGGGHAELLQQPDPAAMRGSAATYALQYTAGPLGIAQGGAVFFQVSPFWGWTTPEPMERAGDFVTGNTEVTCDAAGVVLECATIGQQLMVIRIGGEALPPGATIRVVYGVPPKGPGLPEDMPPQTRVDTYAESAEAFYFWVDGDGDGTRKLIDRDPHVAIGPGPAVDVVLHVPSEVALGAEFDVSIAFLDVVANGATDFTGDLALSGEGLELPATVTFAASDLGHKRVRGRAVSAGIRRVVARIAATVGEGADGGAGAGNGGGGERASNPMVVSERPRGVLWADLHGHSQLSDGTGTPDDYYGYARDVAALDVAVLTDHDHWGMRKLDVTPEMWAGIRDTTARFNDPGRFTTLLGYEWTNWIYGHRHVLYFDGEGQVLSSLRPPTDTPTGLWATLREQHARALTVPHHPAGGPVPIDWSIAPDPEFEPVVEIVSVHGSSESPDSPHAIYSAVDGHWVRDALARGYRLGFVGSGDSHNGHPGLVHLGSPSGGGVAAILAADNTADAVYAALRARSCWATSGPRIVLWFSLGATGMGGVAPVQAKTRAAGEPAPVGAAGEPAYIGIALGVEPLASLELIKNGAVVARVDGAALAQQLSAPASDPLNAGLSQSITLSQSISLQQSITWRDPDRRAGDQVYLRAIQVDGHAAWSSPIFSE